MADVVEVDVPKMSFIVSGNVDTDLVYTAILGALRCGGATIHIHEKGIDKYEVPAYLSNLCGIIHIKEHVAREPLNMPRRWVEIPVSLSSEEDST